MINGTSLAVAVLLEKQTERLDSQARLRERAKACAVEMARRAQVAQAEARQAALNAAAAAAASEEEEGSSTSAGGGGEGAGGAARAVAARAAEEARAASRAAEAAVAEARRLAAEKGAERWLGAEALSTLLAALLECRLVMDGGLAWTAGGGAVHPNDGAAGGDAAAAAAAAAVSSPLQVAQRTCRAIMMQIGVLSEEELKKESPDVRGKCVFVVDVCFSVCFFCCCFAISRGGEVPCVCVCALAVAWFSCDCCRWSGLLVYLCVM